MGALPRLVGSGLVPLAAAVGFSPNALGVTLPAFSGVLGATSSTRRWRSPCLPSSMTEAPPAGPAPPRAGKVTQVVFVTSGGGADLGEKRITATTAPWKAMLSARPRGHPMTPMRARSWSSW